MNYLKLTPEQRKEIELPVRVLKVMMTHEFEKETVNYDDLARYIINCGEMIREAIK